MAAKPLIAGNWKMNGSLASAQTLSADIAARAMASSRPLPRIALCPPGPLIAAVKAALGGAPVELGGQDCHADEKGAHTGDISARLLKDVGCTYVIVGHSERRTDHRETNQDVRSKAQAAQAAGLVPIICVGETQGERDNGMATNVVRQQVLDSLPQGSNATNTVIAYEPVWAIGTGRTATPADVQSMHAVVRDTYGLGRADAAQVTILYGGSVKAGNAASLLAVPGVDGALVGGASLDADEFWAIIAATPDKK